VAFGVGVGVIVGVAVGVGVTVGVGDIVAVGVTPGGIVVGVGVAARPHADKAKIETRTSANFHVLVIGNLGLSHRGHCNQKFNPPHRANVDQLIQIIPHGAGCQTPL
jgi:hypothetical protein